MNLRKLKKNTFKVSEIGLGLSQFSQTFNKKKYGYKTEAEVLSNIRYAIKNGINFFDTSDGYGDTEKILGKLDKKIKDKIVISTKAGRKKNGNRCFDKKYLEKQLNTSLKNLRIDAVDIFMLNKPNYKNIEDEELLEFLNKLKKNGKIKLAGIVIGEKYNFKKIIKEKVIDCFSILFNILNVDDYDLIDVIRKKQKGIIIRSPLNSGILGGKIDSNTKFSLTDERFKYFKGQNFKIKILKFEKLKQFLKLKRREGCSSKKQIKEIVSYQSKKNYMTTAKFNKIFNKSDDLSKKFKTINQQK